VNVGDIIRIEVDRSAVEGTIKDKWYVNYREFVKIEYLEGRTLTVPVDDFDVTVLVSKPEPEPQALGSVYTDGDGYTYVKFSNHYSISERWISTMTGVHFAWKDVPKQ
jgi:hypothetical protein